MKYRIIYNLKGGSLEKIDKNYGNIIWDNTNNIVLNQYILKEEKQKEINYNKFFNCPRSLDPFLCIPSYYMSKKFSVWSHEKVNLDWLKFGMKGMTNCGNTCYFNAYMQCILFTYPLIYNIKLVIQSNKVEENEFERLVSKKFNDNFNPINIEEFKPTFSKYNIMNSDTFQHDSLEYLGLFLGNVTTKYTAAKSINLNILDLIRVKPNKKQIKKILENNLTNYYFFFYTIDKINSKNIENGNLYLSLRIIDKDNLYDCITEYFKKELLEDNITKQFKLLNFPKILIIHLKRYDITEKKIHRKIEMPYNINKIFLENFLWKNNNGECNEVRTYDLYAFIHHDGETKNSGHYISYIKKPRFSNSNYNIYPFLPGWYCANDPNFDMINPYDEDFVDHLNHGYLYFYKARDYDNNDYFHHHIGNEDIKFRY